MHDCCTAAVAFLTSPCIPPPPLPSPPHHVQSTTTTRCGPAAWPSSRPPILSSTRRCTSWCSRSRCSRGSVCATQTCWRRRGRSGTRRSESTTQVSGGGRRSGLRVALQVPYSEHCARGPSAAPLFRPVIRRNAWDHLASHLPTLNPPPHHHHHSLFRSHPPTPQAPTTTSTWW